jgi:beta-lactamase class A
MIGAPRWGETAQLVGGAAVGGGVKERDVAEQAGAGTATVVAAIERELAAFPGTGGLVAKRLETGEEIRVNPDLETTTASTVKVPILVALMRQVEQGKVGLDDRMRVTPEVHVLGSGVLRDLSLGVELSVRDVATLMIVLSDNIATNMLIDLVGIAHVNQTLRDFGFTRTELRDRIDFDRMGDDGKNFAVTTPAELAGMMEALATGRILSDASRAEIFAIMHKQHVRDRIPRYLPFYPYAKEGSKEDNGLRIANKTGSLSGFRADMGLVEWPGTRYVIGVVVDGDPDRRFWPENNGDKLVGRLSRLVFDHFGGEALETASA